MALTLDLGVTCVTVSPATYVEIASFGQPSRFRETVTLATPFAGEELLSVALFEPLRRIWDRLRDRLAILLKLKVAEM